MTLRNYAQEFVDYLCKKIPDINQSTLMEIAEFAAMKAHNYALDEIKRNNKSWYEGLKRSDDLYMQVIKRCKHG